LIEIADIDRDKMQIETTDINKEKREIFRILLYDMAEIGGKRNLRV